MAYEDGIWNDVNIVSAQKNFAKFVGNKTIETDEYQIYKLFYNQAETKLRHSSAARVEVDAISLSHTCHPMNEDPFTAISPRQYFPNSVGNGFPHFSSERGKTFHVDASISSRDGVVTFFIQRYSSTTR
jgi:hypothetical protein